MTDLNPEKRAELRELLAAVDCCHAGPDYALERWGGPEDRRPMRLTAHAQVSMALSTEQREGFFREQDARLIVEGINALPSLLDAADERDRLAAAQALRDAVRAVLDRARIEQDDAEAAMAYAAEINDGLMLASEQARKQAWADAARALTTALESA